MIEILVHAAKQALSMSIKERSQTSAVISFIFCSNNMYQNLLFQHIYLYSLQILLLPFNLLCVCICVVCTYACFHMYIYAYEYWSPCQESSSKYLCLIHGDMVSQLMQILPIGVPSKCWNCRLSQQKFPWVLGIWAQVFYA